MLKYVKRVWFTLCGLIMVPIVATFMVIDQTWRGEFDDDSWNPFAD